MYIVFDTEAKEIASNFIDNGISYLSYYRSDTGETIGLFENDLDKFKDVLKEADIIVGYNLYGYDFPVLRKYYDFDLKEKKVVDIFKDIVKRHNIYLKLDNIAEATVHAGKIAHGLDAVRFYKQGMLDKLKEYCDMDVKLTADVYEFIKKNGYFLYKDGLGQEKKLDLDFDAEEKKFADALF
jgi:DEAD/DEAH box helicase domain-containing protein